MFLIVGQRVCGRVDDVPGICHVATRFVHFYYVPLIPLSSWLIEKGVKPATGDPGLRIPLCGRSVVFGWVQALLVAYGSLNTIKGILIMIRQQRQLGMVAPNVIFNLVLGVLCLAAWMLFTVRPFRASRQRAQELMDRLGIETEVTAKDYAGHELSS